MDSPSWFTEGGSPNTSLGYYCQANIFGHLIDFIFIIFIDIIIVFITKCKVYRVMNNLIDDPKVLKELLHIIQGRISGSK